VKITNENKKSLYRFGKRCNRRRVFTEEKRIKKEDNRDI
jgi:hypothetical protein